MKQYKILFCDLDGTIIDTLTGETFPKGIWDMKLKLDVIEAIKKLDPDYIFIVTNQGGIEKGFITELAFHCKADYVCECIRELVSCNIITKCRYCTSNDKENPLRKPNTGMLDRMFAYVKWTTSTKYTKDDMLMIGDASGKPGQFSDSDKKTAENFNIDYLDVEDFVNLLK